MADIADLGFRVDSSGILKGEKALNRLDGAGNKVVDTSKAMNAAFKASAAAIAAVSAAVVTGVNRYKAYGTALAEVNTLLDSSWDKGSLDNLSDGVRALTKQMGGDVVQNTKALYQVISAGADNSTDAIETLTQANKLAIAGVTDLETAVNAIAGPLNVYSDSNLTAAQASDALLTAVKDGITKIPELAASVGRVASIAKNAGLSFDELTASVATVTAAGISTSETVSGLKAAISAMVAPTQEAEKVIEEMGIKMSQADITGGNWAKVLRDIGEATGGDIEKLKRLLGSMEAVNVVIALTQNEGAKLNSVLEDMAVKTGATDVGFDKMTTGSARLGFEWDKLKSSADATLISLGEKAAPILIGIIDNFDKITYGLVIATKTVASFAAGALGMRVIPAIVAGLSVKMAALNASLVTTRVVTTQATAATGLMGVGMTRAATQTVAMTAAQKSLALATTGLSRAFALIGGPIGLAVIAFTAIALGASDAQAQSDRLSQSLSTLGVSGLDPATAKTEALANEMRELNLITAQNNLLGLNTSLRENQVEIDKAREKIDIFRQSLQLDGLANDAVAGLNREIGILEGNITKAEQVQRLLNVQIGQGKGEVQDMKLAVAGLSQVTVTASATSEVFGQKTVALTGIISDYKSAADNVLASERDRLKSIDELTKAIADGADENGILEKELKRLDGTTEALNKSEAKRLKATRELAKATGTDLLKSQAELNLALDQGAQKTANYEKALVQAKLAILARGGIVEGTKEWDKALEDLGFRVDDTTKKATTMGALWEKTTDSMFDTGQTFFRSALDGWDGFSSGADTAFDSIKNAFKDLVASLLAQWVTSGLVGLFSGDGFSGFSLNNAFGDGSAGSAFGGLFSGDAGSIFGENAGQSFNTAVGVGSSALGVVGGANQIDQGLEQGGTGGAINVISGVSSIVKSASTIYAAATAASAAAATTAAAAAAATLVPTVVGTAAAAATTVAAAAAASAAATTAAATVGTAAGAAAAGTAAGSSAGTAALASNPYGWVALAALAVAGLVSGNSRTPQELGEDQLAAVDQATKEGRNEQVQLGATAGTELSFLGGFDENSIFFGVDLAREELQKVGDVFQEMTGANQALALKDGVIRIEDFNRNFSENNDLIVSQMQASIAQVKLSVTDIEKSTLSSIGGALVEVDRLFDTMSNNGESSADNLAAAYSQAFDTTIEAGHDWVDSTGIDANRIAELFNNTSAEVTAALFGVSNTGIEVFNGLVAGTEQFATNIQGLNGILNTVDLGVAQGKINIPNVNGARSKEDASVNTQSGRQQGSNQNSKDIGSLANQVSRLVDSQTSTNIKQQPMYGT